MKMTVERTVVEEVDVDLCLGNKKAFGQHCLIITVGGYEPVTAKLSKKDYDRLLSYGMNEQG